MSRSLKNILKISTALYIDNDATGNSKTLNIIKLFFGNIVLSSSYKDGLEKYKNSSPNAIITEIELPDKSGIELIKKIREENESIPIIIISTNKEEKNLFEAIKLNLVNYLVKPANADELIFTLNKTAKLIFNNGNITVTLNKNLTYSYVEKALEDNGKKVPLTRNEVKLLELLILNKDKTVTKEEIEYYIWEDESVTESAFKSLFLRLRNKVGKDRIVNNFGIGYSIILDQ